MSRQQFIVIGITDRAQPFFPPEVREVISRGSVFSGGKRHHEIVAPLLPAGAEWIDITAPLDPVFEQYARCAERPAQPPIVVFASGDPLFFGFANTIRRKMPDAVMTLYPSFNSIQMLAHRLVMPYHDLRLVSLTGRPWPEFDRALMERATKIGLLTDHVHTPGAIAQRMLDYGYTDYTMHVGEHLGNPDEERVNTLTLDEASRRAFTSPNCIILTADRPLTPMPFGIPDSDFHLLNGREKMITKMPIRLLTLQALDLPGRSVLWDVGFCTGSVSIEARLLFPHLHIVAFEKRPEGEALMRDNCRRFGTPGIDTHIGDFLAEDLSSLPAPDAVFIGGHGGRLKEIMAHLLTVLSSDGIIVMNSVMAASVTTDSHRLFDEACRELGLVQDQSTRIILNDNNPIEILKCRRQPSS